jgi:hypothetical protein
MELYKYTSAENGINILSNLEIRFTQPNALNDVFEMFPNLILDISEKTFDILFMDLVKTGTLKKEWDKMFDGFFSSMTSKYPSIFTTKEISNSILENILDIEYLKGKSFSEFLFNYSKQLFSSNMVRNLFIKQFIEIINLNVGILSLSETNSDVKMWGNYADSHWGVIICFNPSHPFLSEAKKIDYIENRMTFNLNDVFNNKNDSDKQQIFLKKSIEWEYEKEFRKFAFLKFNKRKLEVNDKYGYPICLFDVPKEAICGIIFGSRTTDEHMEQIYKIVKKKGYDIYIRQACLSENEYKIEIR